MIPYESLQGWNLAIVPGDRRDAINPVHDDQFASIFAAINWAMTSWAVLRRTQWHPAADLLCKTLGLEEPVLVTGDMIAEPVQAADWMPRPYLAFPQDQLTVLFDRTTRPVAAKERYFTDPMKLRFFRDLEAGMPIRAPATGIVGPISIRNFDGINMLSFPLKGSNRSVMVTPHATLNVQAGDSVEVGDVLATDMPVDGLPSDWASASFYRKWDRFLMRGRLYPIEMVEIILWSWFQRHCLGITSKNIHVPAELAAVAALGNTVDEAMIWDLHPIFDYYSESCDAFVFPPVCIGQWDRFRGRLLDVPYNVTPFDSRFNSRSSHKEVAVNNSQHIVPGNSDIRREVS